MTLSLIAAVSENGVIGVDGDLPWRLSGDLVQFKRRTLGHAVLMGRKTWESIPRRPLKKRLNVVMTRQIGYVAEGAEVVGSLDEALRAAAGHGVEEVFVIGGESIYAAALPRADRLVITHVAVALEGDAFFPEVDWSAWRAASEEAFEADARNAHAYRVVVYERA